MQHANPRRIGLELALDGKDQKAALAALRQAVPNLREGEAMSLPLTALGAALRAVAGVILT